MAHLWRYRLYHTILWRLLELFAGGNTCYTIIYCSESDPDILGFFTDRAQCSNRIWDPGGLVSKVQYSCQRFAGVHFLSLPAHYSKVKHNNGFRSHWWLVDSGAGKSMSYDKADFIQLKPWAGGSVKVGDGNIIEVTHRGVIQLYVRAPNGSAIPMPELVEAWYVPKVAFKIISVSDLAKAGVASRFGEPGRAPNYLNIHQSSTKVNLKTFQGVYVLPTVNVANVGASVRVKGHTISPKLHIGATDLWYIFGGGRRPSSSAVYVKGDVSGDINQYCMQAPMPAITALDLLSLDFNLDPDWDREISFKEASLRLSKISEKTGTIPGTVYQSHVPASAVIAELERPFSPGSELACGVCTPVVGESVTGFHFSNSDPTWSWCGLSLCENGQCSEALLGVGKVSRHNKNANNSRLQHYRSGCTSCGTLARGCEKGLIGGIFVSKGQPFLCKNCLMCKAKRASFTSKQKRQKSDKEIEFRNSLNPIVFDYCGPMRHASKGGARGYFAATTKLQRYIQVFPVKSKSSAWECIEEAIHHLQSRFQRKCCHIHTDNAGEHKSQIWMDLEKSLDFHTTYSADYTPQQNSLAEFVNFLLCTKALCMMTLGDAPAWAWAVAIKYAAAIWNATPSANGEVPSPLQLLTGYPPDHSMFRVFWCPCYPLYFKEQGRGKFEIKTRGSKDWPCRFAGMGPTQPFSWLIYDPVRDVMFETAHCSFDESEFDGSKMLDGEEFEDKDWSESMEKLASEVGLWLDDSEPNWRDLGESTPTPISGGVKSADGKAQVKVQSQSFQQPQQMFSSVDPGPGGPAYSTQPQYSGGYGAGASKAPPSQHFSPMQAPVQVKREGDIPQYQQVQVEFGNTPDFRSPVVTRSQAAEVRVVSPPQPQYQISTDIENGGYTYTSNVGESGVSFEVPLTEAEKARFTSPHRAAVSDLRGAPPAQVQQLEVPEVPSPITVDLESDPELLATMIRDTLKIQECRIIEEQGDFIQGLILASAAARVNSPLDLPDPLTYKQAMEREDSDLWVAAIKAELKGMEELDVWDVVVDESKLPKGINITKSKGVYKVKKLKDGSVDKHKYRLVACGYSQIYGLDYTETYAGVVDNVVIRIFLALVAELGLYTTLIDVSQAFLYGELEGEEIFMRLPKELGSVLVKLKKAIYGLKQAGRTYNRAMAKFLLSIGYKQSVIEPCLFYLFTREVTDVSERWNGLGVSYIVTHVDDMPVASNSNELLKWTASQIETKFKITSEELHFFISLQIDIDIKHLRVSFHQEHFALQLVKEFQPELLKFCSDRNGNIILKDLPAKPGLQLSKESCPQTDAEWAEVAGFRYPQLIGSLLYITNQSRHDLMVSVGNCAKFMSNFGMDHWMAALHILQYLAKYPKICVVYQGTGDGNGLVAKYEVDSDFASCPDTRRSRWGCLGFLCNGVIDAKSQKFKSMMPSTGAAEQSALAKCVLRVLATRNYLDDFGFPQWDPTPIGEDNNAALLNSRNPVKSKSQKHLDVYHHITRENQMEFQTIDVYRLPTSEMRADLLTKNLPTSLFWKHTESSFQYQPTAYVLNGMHFTA